MGKSLIESIKEDFELKDIDIRTYSPLNLAYIGDSIYALLAKTLVVGAGNVPAGKLHKETVRYVSAVGQAKIYCFFEEEKLLSEEEADILRRGKSAKSQHSAKNASLEEYRKATAIETLFGWLYLKGETQRMLELARAGFEHIDHMEN